MLFADLQARNARECFGLPAVPTTAHSAGTGEARHDAGQADLASRAKLAEQLDTVRCLRRNGESLSAEVARLRRALEERDQVVKERNTTIQALQDEVHLANLELSQADSQIVKLKEENEMLVQRWIARVNLEAERT